MFEFFRGMFSMNWLTKLMYGRYGTDRLGLFMLIVVLLLDIIFTFTGWDVFTSLPLCWLLSASGGFFRATSASVMRKTRNSCSWPIPSSARSPLKFPVWRICAPTVTCAALPADRKSAFQKVAVRSRSPAQNADTNLLKKSKSFFFAFLFKKSDFLFFFASTVFVGAFFVWGFYLNFFAFLGYTGINRFFLIRRHVPWLRRKK